MNKLWKRAAVLGLVATGMSAVGCSREDSASSVASDLLPDEWLEDGDLLAEGGAEEGVTMAQISSAYFAYESQLGERSGRSFECNLSLATSGALAVTVTFMGAQALATGICAGVMAVTGPGEMLCIVPAANTGGAAVLAMILAGVAAGSSLACKGIPAEVVSTLRAASAIADAKVTELAAQLSAHVPAIGSKCSVPEYLRRTAEKIYWCKLNSAAKCTADMTCANTRANLQKATACKWARVHHNECWPVPDPGHVQRISELVNQIKRCTSQLATCSQ